MGTAVAREWRSPWSTAHERGTRTGDTTLIVVTEAPPVPQPGTGVDITIADLMAGGSELAGVAPRPATSGIGSDVERDLFSDSVPLNAPDAPPDGDEQYLLSGSY